ncbi:MAG: hypothetical protein IJ527_02240 [Prevotella sp.]|nr:hypothetical protein [Prevotella sp.]
MNTLKRYGGMALVLAGALLLAVSYLTGWTSSNLVLVGGFLLVFVGVILYVVLTKSTEKY